MTDQQTIDWLQARLTSAEDTSLSQTRFMAQMTIERSNLEANNKRLQGEVERLRKVLIEAENSLCDVYVAIARGNVEAGKSFASNDKTIIAIRAALQPEEG